MPLALVAAVVALVAVVAELTDVAREPELRAVDLRFDIRGSQRLDDVVIVQLDSATLERLGEPTYPLPRRWHGRVIDRVSRARPRAIVFDIAFIGLTRPADDAALVDAAERAEQLVFVTDRVDSRARTNLLTGDDLLREIGVRPAHAGAPPDSGAVVRRLTGQVDGLETLAVVGAEVASGAEREVDGEPYINFAGPVGTIPAVSFGDVAKGRVPPARFADRIVLVGPGAELESHPTSVGDMSGAEIQANALLTVLHDSFLDEPPSGLTLLIVAALGFGVTLAAGRLPAWGAGLLAVVLVAGIAAAAQLAFTADVIAPVVVPAAAVVVGAGAGAGAGSASRRLRRLRRRFAQYAPETVVERPLTADAEAPLAGAALDATVLFADLRGFTAYCESRSPAEVARVLNRYLGEMTAAVVHHGGIVIDYMGDGVMAAFGVPTAAPDHAVRALDAAREMIGPRLDDLNRWLGAQGIDASFRMGVGINSGRVLAGSVGSHQRLAYTTIGDTTNTAARIEALTKELNRALLISDATRDRLPPACAADLQAVGDVPIRGRSETIRLWSVPEAAPAPA